MNPNYTTIITPLDPGRVDACRKYLRDNAEPRLAGDLIECQPLFRFDKIAGLHFCSFVILDEEGEFAPSLVFEATFDGSREDFLDELLEIAPEGMHEVYRHCTDYPFSGPAAPQLIEEYLANHDVGANTFFSGNPGRTVGQILGENLLRRDILTFLSKRCQPGNAIPARPAGFLDEVRRHVIRGRDDNRWAEQAAPVPWEIRQRSGIVAAAIIAAFVAVCATGIAVGALFGWGPFVLYGHIVRAFEQVSHIGASISNFMVSRFPWIASHITIEPAILHILIALTGVWLIVRVFELFLTSWTKNPHDQLFINRFPLQIAVIVRYALIVFLVGSVVLAIISGMTAARSAGNAVQYGFWSIVWRLIVVGLILAVLNYSATSLKLAVQIRPYSAVRENVRRLLLDLLTFAMVVVTAIGVLLVARHIPFAVSEQIATIARSIVFAILVTVAYGLIGILAFYAIGLLIFGLIRALEVSDKRNFSEPAELIARARENARKYAREEGGINRYQNHLASITTVKPGFIRCWLLRLALFVINLLSRFWFNRGELGGIPTILSARWVMIDGGKRLLFLDNYGGAWESYLNEFIDLAAVKGLNAIWSNTFVSADGKSYGFPASKFLFWKGAQAEQPFKAYVRQSQVETIAWYSAYPTLSVININASTELRQSLFEPLSDGDIDAIFRSL
ncbi:hypothetical protein [Afipia sp. DC4300-2b1]|uniref:hypothetical protein n=1 Tax=Afipia sp. DC4300-2b1 TaxID=2804672 RepID=UPI003CF2EB09